MSDWNAPIIDEFRAHGSTVTTAGFGRPLVRLHHVGARTGAERVTPDRDPHRRRHMADRRVQGGGQRTRPGTTTWLAHPQTQIETPDDGVDGEVRQGAWIAELTDLMDLTSWPTGMRVIVRKERPHPGAQLRFEDVDGMRITRS